MSSEPVYLIYYRYDEEAFREHPKWWLNWLAYRLTGSHFVHVEIAFINGDVYSIKTGEPISKVNDKGYRRDHYECQSLFTNEFQAASIREFLESRIEEGSGFNYLGYFLLPFFPVSGEKKNKWFCSELTATALQEGGLDLGKTPCSISPGELYKIILEKRFGDNHAMLGSEKKPLILDIYL